MKISMLTRSMSYACNTKVNYTCLHCLSCHNQISKPVSLVLLPVYAGLIFLIILGLSKYIFSILSLPPEVPEMLLVIPQIFLYFTILAYFYTSFIPLRCYKIDKDMTKNNSDGRNNVLVEGMLEFDNHIKTDPLEKKMTSHMIMGPMYYFFLTVLGVIFVWIYKYFSL